MRREAFVMFVLAIVTLSIDALCCLLYLTVRPFSVGLYRQMVGRLAQVTWYDSVSCVFNDTRLVITGDVPDAASPAIIIANHQVDADWYYTWAFMKAVGVDGYLKIIMKDSLRNIPIIGWGMRFFEFIFLRRNWRKDRAALYSQLSNFKKSGFPVQLLIFPEGTTVHKEGVDKGNEFARDNNRPVLERLVLPRSTGFAACLDALSVGRHAADASTSSSLQHSEPSKLSEVVVYDLTIAFEGYRNEVPTYEMGYSRKVDIGVPSLQKLMLNQCKSDVHVHVRRYTLAEIVGADSTIPHDYHQLGCSSAEPSEAGCSTFPTPVHTPAEHLPAQWVQDELAGGSWEQWTASCSTFLDRRWLEKEQLLQHFAEHQCFPTATEDDEEPLRVQTKTVGGSRRTLLVTLTVMPFCVMLGYLSLASFLPFVVLLAFLCLPLLSLVFCYQIFKIWVRYSKMACGQAGRQASKLLPIKPRSSDASPSWLSLVPFAAQLTGKKAEKKVFKKD